MILLFRQRLTLIPLLLYWPAIFVATHVPKVPRWVIRTHMSDKILHYLAYLILAFLLWFAIGPDRKVNWRRASVWWILFVMVWYGAFDEWLQGYVGRNTDVMDFFANLAGVLTALVLLSIFSFWPAFVVLTAAAVFILTNFMHANFADLLPAANAIFHLLSYGLFSLLWIRCMYHYLAISAPRLRWLITALAGPAVLLAGAELFSSLAGNAFRIRPVIISAGAIAVVVIGWYITALLRYRVVEKPLK